MTAFQFSLETALRVRARAEQEAEIEFGKAQRELSAAEGQLRELQARLLRTGQRLQQEVKATSGQVVRTYSNYLQGLRQAITKQQDVVTRREEEQQQRRGVVVERRRERQVLEKLRERQYREFVRDQRKKQDKQLDEVATMLDARKGTAEAAEQCEYTAA